jgi:short-subunit dehydrogenase
MQDLTERKVIVITGASSGAGKAMAIELSKTGATLILAARRLDALKQVAEECTANGALVEVVETDTGKIEDMQRLYYRALDFARNIDVWINNAGVLAAGALEDVPAEVNENVIRTNLLGYINGAQQVSPYFKAQGRGILINNISIGGWFPTPYASAYTASKFGLRGFSEALKAELNAHPDIHVIDLYPAFLDTPGIQHAANYTGRVIKPAPPVYDPARVAQAVVKLINDPEARKSITASTFFLRAAYTLFPRLTRNITATVIRKYLNNADNIENTPGNILSPVEFGTSIHGGWQRNLKQDKYAKILMLTAGLAAAFIVLKTKRAL